MLFETPFTHFHSKLKIDIFHCKNVKLLFLKKRFSNIVYGFSDRITYFRNEAIISKIMSHLPFTRNQRHILT